MKTLKWFVLAAVGAFFLTITAPKAKAQSCDVAEAPACPYGYYDGTPYTCAPYGYYNSEWFVKGAFIGAGPWYHGPDKFRGEVNNRLHPDHGYKGPNPPRGEKPDPSKPLDKITDFQGNEFRDGRGNVVKDKD